LTDEIQETELQITVQAPVTAQVNTEMKKDGYNPAVGIPATLLS